MSVEYTIDAGDLDTIRNTIRKGTNTKEKIELDAAVKAHGLTHSLLNLLRMEVCKRDRDTLAKIQDFDNKHLVNWLIKLRFDADAEMFEEYKIAFRGEDVKFDGEKLLGAENRERVVRSFYQKHYSSSDDRDVRTQAANTLLNMIKLLEGSVSTS